MGDVEIMDIECDLISKELELMDQGLWHFLTEVSLDDHALISRCKFDVKLAKLLVQCRDHKDAKQILKLCEFEDSMEKAKLVLDAVKSKREQLLDMLYVCQDIADYSRGSDTPQEHHFISKFVFEGCTVLQMTAAFYYPDILEQVYICVPPAAWILRLIRPEAPIRGLSMFLHSFTSVKMCSRFPKIKDLQIPSPYDQMREIFLQAEAKHKFQLTIRSDSVYIESVAKQVRYLELWKKK